MTESSGGGSLFGSRTLEEIECGLEGVLHSELVRQMPFAREIVGFIRGTVSSECFGTRGLEHPVASLLAFSDSKDSALPLARALASVVYLDEEAVFDLRRRITEPDEVTDAILGSPRGFEDASEDPLVRFLRDNPRSVILLEDPQAVNHLAIEMVARGCETGVLVGTDGVPVPTGEAIFLVVARVGVPSVRDLEAIVGESPISRSRFRDAVLNALVLEWPDHFSSWVGSRFDRLEDDHLWDRYCALRESGRTEEPLMVPPEGAQVYQPEGSGEGVEFREHEMVDDVELVIPRGLPEPSYDVFISYRVRRDAASARTLADGLKAAGWSRFVDWEALRVERSPFSKGRLIEEIVLGVRASRCMILFAAGWERVRIPACMSEEDAIRLGLAMRDTHGNLVKWNWQELELRECTGRCLVFDRIGRICYEIHDRSRVGDVTRLERDSDMFVLAKRFLERVLVEPMKHAR